MRADATPPAGAPRVWRARLEVGADRLAALAGLLDGTERKQAAAFAFERDRRHYTAAHGMLREVLAACTGICPAGLDFALGPNGKPHLDPARDLQFNMSHSTGVALYAVARGCRIGVDVEGIRGDMAFDSMAAQFFTADEAAAIAEASGDRKVRLFFDCWVRKEAWVKAVGCGLSAPLNEFAVPMPAPEDVCMLKTPQATGRWSVQMLDAGPAHTAALAVEGACSSVVVKAWPSG